MRAVVMGRNYTSRLGMIRAAGLAGCEVYDINTDRNALKQTEAIDFFSRYNVKVLRAPEPDESTLLKVLLSKCPADGEKAVLLPTDDYTAAVVDRNQDRLKKSFVFPNAGGKQGEAVRLMDKGTQKKLAEEAGLNTAKGWSVGFDGEGFAVPEDLTYPCFVKVETSFKGRKFYMKKCSCQKELEEHFQAVAKDLKDNKTSAELLIEQYIEIEKEYDIPGFTDGKTAVIPVFIEKGIIHLGVTGTGTLRDSDAFPEEKKKLEAFIKKLGFTGLIDIELFESKGKIYFNELNMRFGATGFAMTGSGINMPEMLIRELTGCGEQTPVSKGQAVGRTFVSEKVIYQEFRDGQISWKEFKQCVDGADFNFIKNNDDPAPGKAFESFIRKYKMKKTIKGFLHRR